MTVTNVDDRIMTLMDLYASLGNKAHKINIWDSYKPGNLFSRRKTLNISDLSDQYETRLVSLKNDNPRS